MPRPGVPDGLLTLAVALAFADASIVVLALPPIYGEFGTTVVGTSWVITVYAIAVVLAAAVLLAAGRRLPTRATTMAGLAGFGAASAACAVAPTMTWLVAGRALQGIGAALLLSGALARLGAQRPGPGARVWATAAAAGLAAGPAIGGALTEAFEWRAIFVVQAPVAVLALVGQLVDRRPATPLATIDGSAIDGSAADVEVEAPSRTATAGAIGLTVMSGALVGALFLGVLLIVEVWRYPPLHGALVVSALPVGLFATRWGSSGGHPVGRVVAGAVGLAGGLVGLALLPTSSAGWAALALGLCGAGLGLLDPVLGDAVLAGRATLRIGALDVGARHAGLVLGLVLIAPILAADLEGAAERAVLAGAETVLEARLDVSDKIDVANAVGGVIDDTDPGRMPDVGAAFEEAGLSGDDADRARDALVLRIEEVLTRAFRPSFLAAAGLALLTLVPALVVALGGAGARAPRWWVAVLAGVVVIAAVAVPVAAWRSGADAVGEYTEADPCDASPDPYSGNGLDPTLQRIALGALNGAACELGVSRERLVLSMADAPGIGSIELDDDELEQALEAGLLRAVDDAEDRGSLPGLAARALRGAARVAPLTLILDGIERLDLLPF